MSDWFILDHFFIVMHHSNMFGSYDDSHYRKPIFVHKKKKIKVVAETLFLGEYSVEARLRNRGRIQGS